VKKLTLLAIPVILCLLSVAAPSQTTRRPKLPPPPEALNAGLPNQAPVSTQKHIDVLQLQREANDLARTAQTIPFDVESVRKGMLPKDVIQKLKQIEKLSKRLRSELNP
jgi:hypothetical protein